MKILLDEQRLLEKALENGFISNKPTETISALIKYYYGKGNDKEKVRSLVIDFLSNKKFYNPVKWDKLIAKMVTSIHKQEEKKGTDKYKLHNIKEISITQTELNVIRYLDDIEYEKFAFAALVCAKVRKSMNPINDGWIDKGKELYDDAKLSKDMKKEKKERIIFELNNRGLTQEALKVDSKKIRVTFIDMNGDEVLKVTDFDDYVYDYLKWRGDKKIGQCVCNKLFEKVTNNQKYCKNCSAKMNREKTKQNMKNNRILFDSEKGEKVK